MLGHKDHLQEWNRINSKLQYLMLGVKQKEAIITKTTENLLLHFISGVILKIRWSLKNKFINIENRFDIRGFQIALEKYIQENIYLWGFPYLNNIWNMRQSNACHSTELIVMFSSKIQIKSCSGIIKTKKTALVNKQQGLCQHIQNTESDTVR